MSAEKETLRNNSATEKEIVQGGGSAEKEAARSGPAKGSGGGEAPGQTVQDAFLNEIRRDHVTVMLYLMNGIKLIGRIKSFDKFSVLLDAGQQEMLIFKHAISTISVQLPRPSAEPRKYEGHGGPRERTRMGPSDAKRE
jgi:host factor-I protein